jgi:IS30 family transposase
MSLKLSMARRKLTIAERWQAIGMLNTGMSSRNIAVQFNVNHTVIGRLRSLIRRRQHVRQQRNISTPQHEISFHRVQRLHSVIIQIINQSRKCSLPSYNE